MWSTEHTIGTTASPVAICEALRDLRTGGQASVAGHTYAIHGSFVVGTAISVKPAGQDEAFTSTIVELVDGQVYADETPFKGPVLRNRHTVTGLASGGSVITHRIEIDGPNSDTVGPTLGPAISDDFPTVMDDLISAASASLSRAS